MASLLGVEADGWDSAAPAGLVLCEVEYAKYATRSCPDHRDLEIGNGKPSRSGTHTHGLSAQ